MKKSILLVSCLFCMISVCQAGIGVPTPYYKSEYCPPERPFTNYGYPYMNQDECLGCGVNRSIYIEGHETDFEVCTERETVNGYSRLKKCPDNFFRDRHDGCISCDNLSFVTVTKESDCAVCLNREVVSVEQYDETFLHCQLKNCPPEAPLTAGGDCFSCDADIIPTNAKEACEKCPDRVFFPKDYTLFENDEKRVYFRKDTCLPSRYTLDRPLLNFPNQISIVGKKNIEYGGGAVTFRLCNDCSFEEMYRLETNDWVDYDPCETADDVWTTAEICARCPNREYKEGVCIFKSCPDGMIEGERDSNQSGKKCFNCDEYKFSTTKENCHQCPNRFFVPDKEGKNGVCLKCGILQLSQEFDNLSPEEKSRCTQEKSKESDKTENAIVDVEGHVIEKDGLGTVIPILD